MTEITKENRSRTEEWTAERILKLRKRAHMSQEEMSYCLGVSVQTLAAGERGLRHNLTYSKRLDAIENALNNNNHNWDLIIGERANGLPSIMRKRMEDNGKVRIQIVEQWGEGLLVPIEGGDNVYPAEVLSLLT